MAWYSLTTLRKFASEIFQDVDGGFSMKRAILAIFVVMFVTITIYVVHYGVAIQHGAKSVFAIPKETLDFLSGVLDKCMDGIKWLGALVLAERAPQAVAAFRGRGETPAVSATPEDHDDKH